MLTGVVGIVYWLVAARFYPPETVGRNAAAISAMMFLAGCAQLNLMSALLRFLPTSGPAAKTMIVRSYLVGGGLSVVAGTVFVLGVPVWAPELAGLVRSGASAVLFAIATGCAAIFVMQDNVLVALGRATAVPVENLVFAVLKLSLVAILAVVAGSNGIWLSWVVGLMVAVAGTTVYLGRRAIPRFAHGPRREVVSVADLMRFIGPDYVGSLCWVASTTLVPVLVLGLTGPAESAAFALPWSICLAAFHVPAAFGQALVAAGAKDPDRLPPQYRQLRRHMLNLLTPAVLLLVTGAPWLLATFGDWYASHGTTTLRLLILSVIPNAVVSLAISRARAERRTGEVAWYLIATGAIVVGITVVAVPRIGIAGAGVGWLVAETLLAGVVLARELRFVRTTPRKAVAAAAVARSRRGGVIERVLPSASDSAVVMLDDAVLRASDTRVGAAALNREHSVLSQLTVDDRLGQWRRLLPSVIEGGDGYLVTAKLPGLPGRHVSVAESVGALDAIRCLHDRTSRRVTLDAVHLDELVDVPAAVLRGAVGTEWLRRAVDSVAADLDSTLLGQTVQMGWTHGDFHPGNVLYDAGLVSGIVDWDQATDSIVALDNVLWLLTATTDRRELGRRVVDRLRREHCWTDQERALLGSPNEATGRALLLLGWLRHVTGNLTKSGRYAASPIWLRRNVVPVLREVSR